MRKSGVLMHISSLPGPFGVGTLGRAARDFIDFLALAGQGFWQVLPVSPTGYGDSPYQSFSSFAGNPYFIDLDLLRDEGYLRGEDYAGINWGGDESRVDYGVLYEKRPAVLQRAAERLLASPPEDFSGWCGGNGFWLEDYALFTAIKNARGGAPWTQWTPELRRREGPALEQERQRLSDEIASCKAVQYLFFHQWRLLREYAHSRGVRIIGDLPIYVSPDSSDLWANPQLFCLDGELLPTEVAGCPPDFFAADGQLWGNPLYNWERMRSDGFRWWISRIAHQFEIYDVLRLDHFRGFDTYYAVPYGESTARNGVWRQGPGMDFFRAVDGAIGRREYIAEDLGMLLPSVTKLLDDSGLPGMRVLQFAFDGDDSAYLPHNFVSNCAAYTGTHDNDTIAGWYEKAPRSVRERAAQYMRMRPGESVPRAMMSTLISSTAELAIVTAQDLLELGSGARMNTPSTFGGNWCWRMRPGELGAEQCLWLREQTELYGRM